VEQPNRRERRVAAFLQDDATPSDKAVVVEPTAIAGTGNIMPPTHPARPAPPKIRPEALEGEYPWLTTYAAARADLRQGFPLRLRTITGAKLQYLYDHMAVRSKAGFVEAAVVAAVDAALLKLLKEQGLGEDAAQAALAEPPKPGR
jgi:hypothetical protein